ncbi:MAG: hypothetical protein KatS3mg105_2210 [Gemmatales bacterium]|nr:MAG: hypothetical protein KatS3mg105_2210 [Gemmatales bacterium]
MTKSCSTSHGFFFPGVLREIVNDSIELLDETIQRVRYLGPLRSYPQRHLAFSEDHDRNWFAGGGYAWDRLRNDSHLRERVNQWLAGSWMKTPYQLVVRDLYGEEDLEVPFLELLQEKEEKLRESLEHEGFDPFSLRSVFGDPEREFSRFCREIAASAAVPIKELALIDVAKKTTVSHRDVGIGISQVLPVLVSAMAAQNETIAIEQPEIHLHPALQAELGDVFIEAALSGRGNRFILETHSEHLLLRIMRRIRETTTEKLPKGCTPITKDDVLVLYVEPDKDGAIAREMPLNEMGELVKAWPGGFFEEGLREIF